MPIQFRAMLEEDLEGLCRVWSLTYNAGKPFEPGERPFKHAVPFVGAKGGEVIAGFGAMEMSLTRGPSALPCAGILAVGVAPHHREGGVGNRMMDWCVRHYRDKGFPLAALYPFRDSFYAKSGYATAGVRQKVRVEASKLPKFQSLLEVKRHGTDALEKIRACYEQFAHMRSGVNLRPEKQWHRILPPDSNRQVYVAGDPAEAYAVVQHTADFWVEQPVEEVVWTTLRGYESIMATLRGIAINKSHLSWFEPSDGPYRQLYWDRGAEFSAPQPQVMYRVLDVPRALSTLQTQAEGQFSVKIIDKQAPANEGPWHVRFSPGGVHVDSVANADFDIDIRRFSQAFLGEPSLTDLLRNGVVQGPEAPLKAAQALLSPSPTFCLDTF